MSYLQSVASKFRYPVQHVPKQIAYRTSKRFLKTESYNKNLTFYLNGQKKVVDTSKFEPDITLIDYLRDNEGLTGTKLTCGEGGCGACTVTISHYDKDVKNVVNRAVNSCLVPFCYVDGMEVTTVEGLGSVRSGKIHPVQERLATFAGSQCGYCTPGFVMSMYTSLKNNPQPNSAEFLKAMDGNLCRCTGYRPIIDAAKTFCADTKNEVKLPDNKKFADYDPTKDPKFPEELKQIFPRPLHLQGSRVAWYTPTTLSDLLQIKEANPEGKLINGSTELGIDLRFKYAKMPVLISPVNVKELNHINFTGEGVEIGSSVTLGRLNETFHNSISSLPENEKHKSRALHAVVDQLHWFAGTQIRNVASLGGNIINASPISDLNPVWVALGATFKVQSASRGERIVAAKDFFTGYRQVDLKPDEVLVSVFMPWNQKNDYVEAYKQSKRREDDIAIVTSGMVAGIDNHGKVTKLKLSFGGMAATTVLSKRVEEFMIGKEWNESNFEKASQILREEFGLSGDPPGGMAEFRTTLALSFFYKFYISVLKQVAPNRVAKELSSATMKLYQPVPTKAMQTFNVPKRGTSVGDSATHQSGHKQTTGEAKYTTDLPVLPKQLYAALVTSTRGHAKILKADYSAVQKYPGVTAVYTYKDIPGNNVWGDIVQDEELLASNEVHHYGQPIAAVVADSEYAAKNAAKLAKIEYEDLTPIYSIEDAIKHNSYFPEVLTLNDGDIQKGFKESDHVIEGNVNLGGQEQFYFEPMITVAVPDETDMVIYSSTQNTMKTQKIVASALGIHANKVLVRVNRIGGGFGGKETRNINFSCIAAVAAHHLNQPVKLLLERDLDMTITGGRHPFRGEYKIGFTKDGMIKAADVKMYNNGGFTQDLSYPVIGRAVLFADSCYKIPNIHVEGRVCKTNMPSHTAFRGFGGPQGHLITEAWVAHMAHALGVPVEKVREQNMYYEGEHTYYGQQVTKNIRASWQQCKDQSQYEARLAAVKKFNEENRYRKRGIAMMPSKYGVAFTFYTLNQGAALVHIYTDGTVLVTHGGVEMGQGLNTKVAQVVATELGIPLEKVHIRDTTTDKIPNSSATAASMGSDIYGMAAFSACKQINERLEPYRKSMPNASFKEIVDKAYHDRVNLSAQGFFKSEHKGFDWKTGKGEPWRYFTLGTACTEVEVDTLTGDFKVLRNDLVVDIGKPINPAIDIGQIEGAFVQGMGWCTIEELVWGDNAHPWVKPGGRLFACGPGAYKIPSGDDIPNDWRVTLMQDTPDKKFETIAVHSSKAVGEPPLLLGISVFFAIREAIMAARKQEGLSQFLPLDSPLTSERIRMACSDKFTRLAIGNTEKADNFRTKGSF